MTLPSIVKDFINFIVKTDEKYPHKEINHSDWTTCAVGDFALKTTGNRGNYRKLLYALEGVCEPLYHDLILGPCNVDLFTYKGLAKHIQANYPELLEADSCVP